MRLKRAMLAGTDYFPPEEATIMASAIRESDMIPNDAIETLLSDIRAGKTGKTLVSVRPLAPIDKPRSSSYN